MRKLSTIGFLIWSFAVMAISGGISAFMRHKPSHVCKWDLCPYKDVTLEDAREAVIEYTGEDSTIAYYLDYLHIQHPDFEYETLEQIANNYILCRTL